MAAYIEKVPQRYGRSWRFVRLSESRKQVEWHYHQEFELVLHRHFEGSAWLGHYQGVVRDPQLLLLAPDLPHAFQSADKKQNCTTLVLWFKKEWLANMMFSCAELRKLENLLVRAQKGIAFSAETALAFERLMEGLEQKTAINQLATLLQVFSLLAEDKQTTTLLSYPSAQCRDKEQSGKIDKLCHYMETHFHQPLSLDDLAAYLHTSPSSIHRLFKLHFQESFTQYLSKLRLNHAAELLQSTGKPVSLICEEVGYRNQANFNRQFKQYKGLTPGAYRRRFQPAAKV